MKSNFNDLFKERLDQWLSMPEISINDVLDEMMPLYRYKRRVSKQELIREELKTRLISGFNSRDIYSVRKGVYVYAENASEEQAIQLLENAKRQLANAKKHQARVEMYINQISFAWDENGNYQGLHIPKAVNE